ncbi:MAG: PspC domain-containing protein [Firmicutes bacterium]|nr:PspC domain-containing protein [Bacillota bacterium]
MKKLYRSRTDKKLFGVCGGLAQYMDLDPTIMRLIAVILLFVSFGWAILIYLVMGLVMPIDDGYTDI